MRLVTDHPADKKPESKTAAKSGREARLAEALRANLRRRKEAAPAKPDKKD
jgi:hypothetical protein